MKIAIFSLIITTLVLTTVFAFAACSSNDPTASKNDNSSSVTKEDNSSSMNKEMDHKDGEMDHGNSSDKNVEPSNLSAQKNSQTPTPTPTPTLTPKAQKTMDKDMNMPTSSPKKKKEMDMGTPVDKSSDPHKDHKMDMPANMKMDDNKPA